MDKKIVFIDIETRRKDKTILDVGAVWGGGSKGEFHSPSLSDLFDFIAGAEFVCGHNAIHHDIECIEKQSGRKILAAAVDTLYISPLLFPGEHSYALSKAEKTHPNDPNDPVMDSKKARDRLHEEIKAFEALSPQMQQIYCCLLHDKREFRGFFEYIGVKPSDASSTADSIRREFGGRICSNADIEKIIEESPAELAYALAQIGKDKFQPVIPPWLLLIFPRIENVISLLRNTPCREKCEYCRIMFDEKAKLKEFFKYDSFRTFDGKSLQEDAVRAAVEGRSLLAVFPTGGGKSITFQLPALIAGEAEHGLTVVISPLQSLMKDQVDKLAGKGITGAVTINGLLDPIERADACERILNGTATLLYISPEQLRSPSIEKLLLSRSIARFVIDEAHCFSAWGQDFRVDYLYIGDFIRNLTEKKQAEKNSIPVSCFTATARKEVISDICDYFKQKLGLDLEEFTASAERKNLHYKVLLKDTDDEKYIALRDLISEKKCPTIVYVANTRRTREIAERLTSDGIRAAYFHGKMDPGDKIANQEDFIGGKVDVIVATSAFGMGIDKEDVGLVIHFDISDSLENYIQESGRAGRDPSVEADCYVLYNDDDLDELFTRLNQTKLNKDEIRQVWKAIKDMTKNRPTVSCSALEIARNAGWDDSVRDLETRVKEAVAALEDAKYLERGQNDPRICASGIRVNDMKEASELINKSPLFDNEQRTAAERIIRSLISKRNLSTEDDDDAESRVDYLADTLGLQKRDVVDLINLMRRAGLLDDSKDMSAYIMSSDSQRGSAGILDRFAELEKFIISKLDEDGSTLNLKEINDEALSSEIGHSSVKDIRTVLHFLTIKNYICKKKVDADDNGGGSGDDGEDEEDEEDGEEEREKRDSSCVKTFPTVDLSLLKEKFYRRIEICKQILDELYIKAAKKRADGSGMKQVVFSLVEMYGSYTSVPRITDQAPATEKDVEEALLYLSKIGAMRLEGGFLVLYNGMKITRLVPGSIQYKDKDYRRRGDFYKQKTRQIHIVGEYAKLMAQDSDAANAFVKDYFAMDQSHFISKYFKGERAEEINKNITPGRNRKLHEELSKKQAEIVDDTASKCIVVAAGPGSGKTHVLVRKLASLLQLEDIKHDQFLMLTFSRAAAAEFKNRLVELVGGVAYFAEIKTFHSYCFDLLGKIGNIEESENVVLEAVAKINEGGIEQSRITKQVLVIDEAQDMGEDELALVRALRRSNSDMRVIAVGDDDQNIYEFRGSDPKYFRALCDESDVKIYEMTENFRSGSNIVKFADAFVHTLENRMKSEPLKPNPKTRKKGTVRIINHVNSAECCMAEAVADHVGKTYVKDKGTACVLTSTNKEALAVLGSLLKRGIKAKLIQSTDGENLYNLAEIRDFLDLVKQERGKVISDECWESAKKSVLRKYSGSTAFEILNNFFRSFEADYKGEKYLSDLKDFINESNYEDFYDEKKQIYVSTIHKAKGQQFNAVYMMLDNVRADTDEEKRLLYVGMTRAISSLYIHCNNGLFSDLFPNTVPPGAKVVSDSTSYPAGDEISLRLTLENVYLNFFASQKHVGMLRPGDELGISGSYITSCVPGHTVNVAKFSRDFEGDFQKRLQEGYKPVRAEVRFVVLWKGQDGSEKKIVLPNIYLKKE